MRNLFAWASSSIESHFKMHHTTTAVEKDDMAYTSASTAENQNESENAYVSEPTMPDANSSHFFSSDSNNCETPISLRPNNTIDQKRNRTVKALANALIMFNA